MKQNNNKTEKKSNKTKQWSFFPREIAPAWASSAQTAHDYFISLHIRWRVFPQLVRAIRVSDKMAEDPLMLKQEFGMMLTQQFWSISSGTLPRICVDAQHYSSGAQLPELTWSWQVGLNLGRTMTQIVVLKVIVFSLLCVSQELRQWDRGRICIAWQLWYV